MKFEKQLQFHAVPTWKRKYIAYGEAKAILRRIKQALHAGAEHHRRHRHDMSINDDEDDEEAIDGAPHHLYLPPAEHAERGGTAREDRHDGEDDEEEQEANDATPLLIDGARDHEVVVEEEEEDGRTGARKRRRRRSVERREVQQHWGAAKAEELEELELAFFRLLREEQAKVDDFYHQQLNHLLSRSHRLSDQLHHFEAASLGHIQGDRLDARSLKKASKALEKAVVNFYRHLMLLDNYALLNYTAFQKLLKKHDRITHLSSAEYLELIQQSPFVVRSSLTALIRDTEEQFRDIFAQGSLHQAKARLLARQHDYFDLKVLLLGLGHVQEAKGAAGWQQVLPVYRLSAMPILGIWLWGVNVLIWYRTRVNHVYIFDLNPTSALSHVHIFKFAGFLSLLWGTSFFLYAGSAGGHFYCGPPEIYPLALTVILVFMIVCPFNVLHRSSRIFFLQILVSVVLAPFGKLRFVDGYLGDLLTSMVKTLGDAEYTVCYYTTGDWLDNHGRCQEANRYGAAAMACLPLFWRMMQCLGRYSATKHVEHLGNSTKYAVALSVVLFSQLYGDLSSSGGEWGAVRILWCISFIVSTLYSYAWDFFMDWGLGRWHSHNFPLRDELFYAHRKWFYYYVIVSNFIFRFFWTITLSGTPVYVGIDSTTMGWIAATVEIVRRFTWSLLRVENEYQSKAGDVSVYRDTDFIPLPFQVNKVEGPGKEDKKSMEWLMTETSQSSDVEEGGAQQRSVAQAKAHAAANSSLSSSYEDDDGDMQMLYSINSST